MARAPVRDIPLSSELRPVATPVDTFVKPGPSPLRGLAESLATTDGALRDLINARDKKAEDEQELRGKAAFYTDHEGELAQAITEGKLPAYTSPFYVRGFKNAQGTAAGDALRTKWQDAWTQWDGKDSEDPNAFDTFFHGFIAQNLGTEDPDVLRGFMPSVEALQANARTQFNTYRDNRLVKGNLDARGAVISGTVQQGLEDGLVSEQGTDYTTIFAGVDKVVTDALATGDPGGKTVDTFIDVMSAKILETSDPKLLDWFDRKVPGKDYTYGQTPHGLEVKNATTSSLETTARQQAAGLTAKQKAEQERLKDEAQVGIINGIIADPHGPVSEDLLKQAEKNGDPTIRVKSKQWREDLLKGTSDPNEVAQFYDDVISGRKSPKVALREALAKRTFGTSEDLKAASGFVQSYETSEDAITKALNGQVSKQILGVIQQRLTAKDVIMLNPVTGISDEGLEASSDFRQLLTRWIINNPNASTYEIDEQASKFGKLITDRFSVPQGYSGKLPTYDRDPNLSFENPYTSEAGQGPSPSPSAPAATTTTAPTTTPSLDVQQWEQKAGITDVQRQSLQRQASEAGMSYEEYMRSKVPSLRSPSSASPPQTPKAPDGTAVDPINYTPNATEASSGSQVGGDETVQLTPEQAESFIDKVFSEATATGATAGGLQATGTSEKSLLDLIAIPESRGNYNAVFGNVNSTRDLSKYSVDDILAAQQEARQRGAKSTAIGRYQFIYKTLGSLKAEMGLTGREAFTPELQDRMGVALLNRRGLQAFKEGRISKKTFALSLSQEWAGLPNPETGRSYYHGDGLNKSGISTGKVYAALGFGGLGGGEAPVPSPSSGPLAYDPYANIPDTDGTGAAGQKAKFLQWNPDPVGNHEANLKQLQPSLGNVIRRAQELSGVRFAIGSGKRDAASQQKAVEWGWSKTLDSDHLDGSAVDLWPVDEKGAINFDPQNQTEIVKAMKKAAKELGVELDIGADWKRFTDKPHFALKKQTKKQQPTTPEKEV